MLAACGSSEPERPSCLLITLDTTNPGALDCYGRDRGFTPNLAALAREGLVYDNARAVAPTTLPSHASVLTGLYPIRHSARQNGFWPLPEAAETLAERARAAGMQTAAVTGAAVLADAYGLGQGFDFYDSPRGRVRPPLVVDRDARQVTEVAAEWLRGRDRERPFFLWAHYYDPHFPYEPPAEFAARAEGNPYYGEVAYMDDAIGDLLDVLREDGGLDETIVLVIGDHGESLGRHGEPSHGMLVYDSTLRIPWITRYPDGHRAGEREPGVVTQVDVFPTLLEALDLGEPGSIDGESFHADPVPADRGVYFESYYGYVSFGWSQTAGWVDAKGKLVVSSSPQFFDVRDDPGETRDLYEPDSGRIGPYVEALRRIQERPALKRDKLEGLTEADRAAVLALGYGDMGDAGAELPAPLDPVDRPAPHERVEEWRVIDDCFGKAMTGERDQAIEQLFELAETTPNPHVLNYLARFLSVEKRQDEAAEVMLQLLALDPILPSKNEAWIRNYLGYWYQGRGDWETALEYYKEAMALDPGVRRHVMDVVRALRELGHDDEAERVRAHAPPADG